MGLRSALPLHFQARKTSFFAPQILQRCNAA